MIDPNMPVSYHLTRHRTRARQSQPINYVIQTPLEHLKQVLPGRAGHSLRFVEIPPHISFGDSVLFLHPLLARKGTP
jgi:hypothetical protein